MYNKFLLIVDLSTPLITEVALFWLYSVPFQKMPEDPEEIWSIQPQNILDINCVHLIKSAPLQDVFDNTWYRDAWSQKHLEELHRLLYLFL